MSQTVLIIDDSPAIHSLLEVRLRPERLILHHVLSGEEGIARAKALVPDLILLDVSMPEMTGFDVCQRLQNEPATAAVPVIFLTAQTDTFSKVAGLDLGAFDYVTKPFDGDELRARVRAAMRRKRPGPEVAAGPTAAAANLWNRAYFDQRLREEVAAAQRFYRKLCLALMEIDGLADLKQAHGANFHEQVHRTTGEALAMCLRGTDAMCRFDESRFAMLFTETDAIGGANATKRLKDHIATLRFHLPGREIRITASFGVSASQDFRDRGRLTARNLIEAATQALETARQAGGDRIQRC